MDGVTSAPQDVGQQNSLSASLAELEQGFTELSNELSPQELERLSDIRADKFFSADLVDELRTDIAANAMSPAVVRDKVTEIIQQRESYLNSINVIIENFKPLGVDEIELEEGEAEIGFQIPRNIFENNLDGFMKELSVLRYIVNTFSDVVIGESQEIELSQLSTSDPLIILGIDTTIIYHIAGAFSWALGQWYMVEKIRNLRAQTAEIGGMDDIEKQIEEKIESTIQTAIKQKAKELAKEKSTPELNSRLKFALTYIMERVERGMTVEIRMLPLSESDDNDDENTEEENQELVQLYEIRQQLRFPEPSQNPILKISAPQDNGKAKPKK